MSQPVNKGWRYSPRRNQWHGDMEDQREINQVAALSMSAQLTKQQKWVLPVVYLMKHSFNSFCALAKAFYLFEVLDDPDKRIL